MSCREKITRNKCFQKLNEIYLKTAFSFWKVKLYCWINSKWMRLVCNLRFWTLPKHLRIDNTTVHSFLDLSAKQEVLFLKLKNHLNASSSNKRACLVQKQCVSRKRFLTCRFDYSRKFNQRRPPLKRDWITQGPVNNEVENNPSINKVGRRMDCPNHLKTN